MYPLMQKLVDPFVLKINETHSFEFTPQEVLQSWAKSNSLSLKALHRLKPELYLVGWHYDEKEAVAVNFVVCFSNDLVFSKKLEPLDERYKQEPSLLLTMLKETEQKLSDVEAENGLLEDENERLRSLLTGFADTIDDELGLSDNDDDDLRC